MRDELLGRPVADRDWVVVGATPEILIASGYKPVGRDFPVFLHGETGEEYALDHVFPRNARCTHSTSATIPSGSWSGRQTRRTSCPSL